jgi:hypothetical protein
MGFSTVGEIYNIVRQAIVNRNIVAARYRRYMREMCPHIIGTKDGREQALLYQFAGESSSGLKPDGSSDNWRCVRVDELSDISVRKAEGEWHTASNYSAMQTCVDKIDVKVEAKGA